MKVVKQYLRLHLVACSTSSAAGKEAMETASPSDLESAAVAYKEQLEQVKGLLLAEPSNAEYLQVRKITTASWTSKAVKQLSKHLHSKVSADVLPSDVEA